MPHSTISSPESFITSLILEISCLSTSVSLASQDPTSSTSPSSHTTFNTLLSRLSSINQESIKRLLTTLHFLFPHELIPALDLLDRRLVTRLVNRTNSGTPAPGSAAETTAENRDIGNISAANEAIDSGNEVFYVQSASASARSALPRNRHQRAAHHSSNCFYEVRLSAWNCTCPTFAFSAFSRSSTLHDSDEHEHEHEREFGSAHASTSGEEDDHDSSLAATDAWRRFRFGGTLTRHSSSATGSEPESEVPSPPVPVCKHILAACLGKHVPNLFDSGVDTRKDASLEEVAGWAGGWGD